MVEFSGYRRADKTVEAYSGTSVEGDVSLTVRPVLNDRKAVHVVHTVHATEADGQVRFVSLGDLRLTGAEAVNLAVALGEVYGFEVVL